MKTAIEISKENSEKTVELLADEFVLYRKTLWAYWNLEGHNSIARHVIFEDHCKSIKKIIDSIAERIRKIGYYAPASLSQFLKLTHLTEKSISGNSSQDYINMLIANHNIISQFIRENIPRI